MSDQRMSDLRMSDLRTWSETQDLKPTAREALSKLFADEDEYSASYFAPGCYRTSNQVDRPMNRIRRSLYASRGVHGHQ